MYPARPRVLVLEADLTQVLLDQRAHGFAREERVGIEVLGQPLAQTNDVLVGRDSRPDGAVP
jgi:hypothetical protein